MSAKLDNYFKAVRDRETAEKWVRMAKDSTRNGSSFSMSTAHSTMKLTRCGQYSEGGKNYWETETAFNDAMLQWIKQNLDVVQAGAIGIMKQKEDESLRNCQAFLNEMQEKINEVKREDAA